MLFEDLFDKIHLVSLRQEFQLGCCICALAEQRARDGVKGTHADLTDPGGLRQQSLQASSHFQCGLAGKGNRHNLSWFNDLVLNEISYSMSKHSGLAGSSTGENEKGPFGVFNRQPLSFVEML